MLIDLSELLSLEGKEKRLSYKLEMKEFQTSNWEYSHMISTIGNINWFCGYYSVALALPVAGFLKSEGRRKQAVLYGISVLGLFLLFVQGSDTGVMLAGMCLLICMI